MVSPTAFVSRNGAQVIVLYQHHIVETEAMILSATGHDRGLFQNAQTRRGLAGIENFRGMFAHRFDKLTSQGGDPAQALEKIQRDPFRFEDGPGQTLNLHDGVARLDLGAVFANDLDFGRAIDSVKNFGGCVRAGDDGFFARDNSRLGLRISGDEKLGRDIAVANVFLQRDSNRIVKSFTHEIRSAR